MEEDIKKIHDILKQHGILNTLQMLKEILDNNVTKNDTYIKKEIPEEVTNALTESNLRMWVVDEKQSFKRIAERLGCNPEVVSAAAKKYGIKSHYTAQMRMIVNNRIRLGR